jgi:hypothetical protein
VLKLVVSTVSCRVCDGPITGVETIGLKHQPVYQESLFTAQDLEWHTFGMLIDFSRKAAPWKVRKAYASIGAIHMIRSSIAIQLMKWPHDNDHFYSLFYGHVFL